MDGHLPAEDHFFQRQTFMGERTGAQFVANVTPYEKKIRLLNAGHSVLGILGSVYG
jgi:mannitol-1-phosphate/altronate dehydrogenase